MVKVTWACPENRVWSQTFTPGGWGHQKQTTSSGRRAPEVAVWTRDIYKHGVHNSFVIYKYTAVLQVFKFHKKEEGRGKGEKKTTQRTKQKGKKKRHKKKQKQNKARLTTQPYRSKDDRELTYSHTFVVCTSITEVATHGEGGSHVCLRLATPSTHIHAHRHARPHAYRTHAHTSTRTDTPAGQQAKGGGYHQSASSSM